MNFKKKVEITMPSNGAVLPPESGFAVKGNIFVSEAEFFSCEIRDISGKLICHTDTAIKNNRKIKTDTEGLIIYPPEIDKDHTELSKAGFVEIMDEPAYFDDTFFRTVFNTHTLFDDSIGSELHLEEGNYTINVLLLDRLGFVIAMDSVAIKIQEPTETLICRFNPPEHKKAITEWAMKKGFRWSDSDLPGYLNPYHNNLWLYHMGILKQYRANDLALYKSGRANMFIHNIESDSTSYSSEFAWFMKRGLVSDSQRMRFWCYKNGKDGTIINLDEKPFHVYSIDRNGEFVIVSGVVKPYQMNPDDFELKEDNTFEIKNSIEKYRITLSNGIESISNTCDADSQHLFEFKCKIKAPDFKLESITIYVETFDTEGNCRKSENPLHQKG